MTNPIADPGHGHSPAAWTAVVIMLLGFAVGTTAFFLEVPVVVWVGVVLIVVGAIVGWVLAKAGYGVKGPKYQPKGH
ncbi:DUF6704 family protein [Microbacterium sp. ASV81]|uniref:HGxxPAAW family protein n=1 Tax=Microbacterium capsulatum TaxID=3041921 RepID=A0ABU0XCJ4_9MICO|nr:DUF6704 family protein [Microbacterium sp. ASV81]MDQ4212803.1 HGxxPAAW family protein [Microbacterium sp. ASV81]